MPRFVVKVQTQPPPSGRVLVYDESRSLMQELEMPPEDDLMTDEDRQDSQTYAISPAQYREALEAGFVPGDENLTGWLVRKAQEAATLRTMYGEILKALGEEGHSDADWHMLALALGVARDAAPEAIRPAVRLARAALQAA